MTFVSHFYFESQAQNIVIANHYSILVSLAELLM